MTTELARRDDRAIALTPEQAADADEAVSALVMHGDLSKLSPRQRIGYFLQTCADHGLRPSDRPFDFIVLDNRLVMYPNKVCAEQLRYLHQISVEITRREPVGDLFVVEARGRRPNGQTDTASKYVPTVTYDREGRKRPLSLQKLADAYAKCETGAKRRLTFSMVGLGGGAVLPGDEDAPAGARRAWISADGNVIEHPSEEQRYLLEHPRAARAAGFATIEDVGSASAAPLPGLDRTPRAEDLQAPKRPDGPRPTLGRSEEDVKRLLGAWFAAVKDGSLDDDDARHRYVEQWTASEGWPANKRTASLRTFFARATDAEAADFLAHVRALAADEQRATAEALAELRGGEQAPEDDEAQF